MRTAIDIGGRTHYSDRETADPGSQWGTDHAGRMVLLGTEADMDLHHHSVYNGVVGLAFLIGAAEALAKELNMNARSNMILSLGAYFLIVANPQTYELADGKKINAITFSKLGTNGIFASIIIVILVALIVQFFQKYKIDSASQTVYRRL